MVFSLFGGWQKFPAAKGFPGRAKKHSPCQKRRRFLFSESGLSPFQPDGPLATASLCGEEDGRVKTVSPGQRENFSERPTKLEMILKFQTVRMI